ncbi:MAG: hypothetical protein OMM_06463 [Candidatus Magnetoglobus multicellularis str. Araruama]|uniref:Uncharacterized protein n=1 Tax=Candidatus Magnetoglobus multicellularis str. Araruama TaxID=890399 RepID=A0A1V1PH41_9BACT|nr:MAG: hypothetical protein OMM_06463 [Candidatus Magnetoglobus multicellularis str. Araruama]
MIFFVTTAWAQLPNDTETRYQSRDLPSLSILSYNIEKLCQEYRTCNATRVQDLLPINQSKYELLTDDRQFNAKVILSKTMNDYWSIQVNQKHWFVRASDQHLVFELIEHARQLAYGKQYHAAEQNINKALKLKPDMDTAYALMAFCKLQQSQFDQFIKHLEKAIHYKSTNPEYLNQMAWFYATTKYSKYRNATKALQYALKAVSILPDHWAYTDTLAAAYACNAQFHEALATQEKSMMLVRNSDLAADEIHHFLKKMNQRKKLYQHRKAYTETH